MDYEKMRIAYPAIERMCNDPGVLAALAADGKMVDQQALLKLKQMLFSEDQ